MVHQRYYGLNNSLNLNVYFDGSRSVLRTLSFCLNACFCGNINKQRSRVSVNLLQVADKVFSQTFEVKVIQLEKKRQCI